jgi:hypothetical protein
VRWKDMSRGTTDFTSMFSTDELNWAQFGWKTWVTACSNASTAASYTVTPKPTLTTIRTEVEEEAV